jgi:PilZ domain
MMQSVPGAMLTRTLAVERSHLLCVGTLARLEVSDDAGNLGVEGTITAIDDQRLTVRFRELTAPLSPRMLRDRLAVLKVWDRFGMHRAEAQIQGVVEEGSNAAVIVGAPTHFVGTQTRRFTRVPARLALMLERAGADVGLSAPLERTLSWDVSAGGLSFLSDISLEIDDLIVVTMILPQEVARLSGELPRLETRVVHTGAIPDSHRRFFGVEFQNVSGKQRDRLVEVVLGLQRIMR